MPGSTASVGPLETSHLLSQIDVKNPLNTAIRLSSRDVTRGAPGAEATAETDSMVEQPGFELLVPPHRYSRMVGK